MDLPGQPQTGRPPEKPQLPSGEGQSETVDYGSAGASVSKQPEGRTVELGPAPKSPGERLPEVPGHDILAILGRGGMGVVYKARHRQLKRLVALKMVLAGAHAGPEELERFRIEAEAVAHLQHPGIVQIYEIGEHDGCPYFSLEFVAGGSLQAALAGTPLPPRRAAELTLALARAVHHAHQCGVVHRDLKPANVLLTSEGQPRVSDFGLAKRLDEAGRTHTGQILGTPSYMAPEQAGGKSKDVGPHTDTYALGAILYECLTGRAPFRAAGVAETLELVRTQEPVPPGRLQPGTPRDLETICLKCLQKEPARRYASAAALADDLQRYLDGRPIAARPIGVMGRAWRWCRRNPRVAIPSILALLLLVAATVVSSAAYLVTSAALADRETALGEKDTALGEKDTALIEKGTALGEKTIALGKAKQAQEEEARQRRLAVERLVRFSVANGARLMEDGDSAAALLYFIDALKNDPDNEDVHRCRIARVLDAAARPVHVGFHERAVAHVAFSPGGDLLVSAGEDGTARLWDLAGGAERGLLRHKGQVRWAAFDRTGEHVATGGNDGVVQVWRAASGRALGPPLALRRAADHVAFSPDGKRVAAAGGDKYGTIQQRTMPGPMQPRSIPSPTPGRPPTITMVPGHTITTTHNPHGIVRVWNAADGADVCTLVVSGWFNRVMFSPRGDQFATAGSRGTAGLSAVGEARVWRAVGGKAEAVTEPLVHPAEVTAAVFSPDGGRLLTACGQAISGRGEARVWDLKTGQLVGRPMGHALQVIEAAFSPDGRFVLTASNDATARVWDAETGEPVTAPLRHGDRLTAAMFSPDGRRILTASRDGTARIWDAASGDPAGPTLHHGEPVTTAAFASDGRRVATATPGGIVRVWDLGVALPQRQLRHGAVVLGVAFGADGKHLVSAPGKSVNMTMHGPGLAVARQTRSISHLALWDTTTGSPVCPPLSHGSPLTAASLSPDGRLVLTIGPAGTPQKGSAVRAWHVASGEPEGRPFPCSPLAAAFASDGRGLAVASERVSKSFEVKVWDTSRQEPIGPALLHAAEVRSAALSADGRTLVTASVDKSLHVWDVAGGREIRPALRTPHLVAHVALSSDCSRLLTLAGALGLPVPDEGKALLWDLGDGRSIPLPQGGPVEQAVFSRDGKRVATASTDGTARIWDAADGRPLTRPLRHTAPLTHAAFSADGRMLATAGHDRTARLWDAHTGEPLGPPLPHSDVVTASAFSPDGRQLATACMDGAVRIWDLSRDGRTPVELFTLASFLAGRRLDDTGGLASLDPAALRTAHTVDLKVSAERALAWHAGEADDAQRRRQWLGMVLHVGKLIEGEPKQSRHRARRARALAELGRWAEAADDFARAAELGDADDATVRGLALCRLATGQVAGYRAACAELLTRLGRGGKPAEVYSIARVLVLGPDAVKDYPALLAVTEKLAAQGPRGILPDLHATALLRAGRSAEAIERLSKALKPTSTADAPGDWLLLALLHRQRGEARQAGEWLQKAVACLDRAARSVPERPRPGVLPWHRLTWEDRLALTLLRREAERAVQGEKSPDR